MSRDLKKIMAEQKIELARLQAQDMLDRIPMKKVDVFSPLAQAVIGMRRSGKSVVCRKAMKDSGVAYGYVDFDDETLAKIDVSELDTVLQVIHDVYGPVDHLLFDEIQNELMRRREDDEAEIYYYRDQTNDIDFCRVRYGKVVELIQVAYTIDGEKTRKRELAPLLSVGRKMKCAKLLLITDHNKETVVDGDLTVEVVPAREWMLR